MPYFGAHMSVSGGLHLAFSRIRDVGGESLQIFTRNQRQWKAAPISPEELAAFDQARQDFSQMPIASHDSYLINLAGPKKEVTEKSIDALSSELQRSAVLKIPYVVMHTGAHLGTGVDEGIKRFCRNLDRAICQADGADTVMVLLETTAGQGSGLGASFAELAAMMENSKFQDRLGICYDTCHTFAAGYDIRTPEAYEKTFNEFDRLIGVEHIRFFHLNDSQKDLGSRVDRHEHIGKGKIGAAGFRLLINDPRFQDHPMVLETPKSDDLHEDIENITFLKSLLG